ncbi:hypothetical protein R8Z50_03260 [Longispora sp. K20-0274]|uniref:hypothetical protein n=1 Tax=Longispora sp. K20-0274 TaxID=3088255 RepID=UPI00399A431F
MVTALARIARLAGPPDLDAATVTALLWDTATTADRIEHVRARAGPDGIDILAFLDLTDPEEAHLRLRALVQRAIATTPRLRAWRVI